MASRTDNSGEVPGLQSVAIAIGTPVSRNAWTGGCLVSFSVRNAPGNSTALVPARAIAVIPAALEYSR